MQDGTSVGPYVLEQQVGKGGMATVFRARHARLDRFVAIKVMHSVFLQDETFRTRFEREAQIVARLEHPNIVPIYDYSEQDGSPYLVMRFIDGLTLKQRMFKSGLSLQEVLALMRQIGDALDYAHRQGVLHRDLKPSNILIDQAGKPWLTDFGLARMAQVGESTISHDMMLGTPFYVSPEQAQGDRDLTSLTDLYSFAVILYELITGVVPFSGDTAYAIIHAHIYAQPAAPSEQNDALPRALDAVILKALAKRPQDRYPTAGALMDAFAAAIGAPRDTPAQAAAAPAALYVAADVRRGKIEASLDLSRINFEQLERQVEKWGEQIEQWGEEIEARFDESGSKRPRKDALTTEEKIRRRIKKQQEEWQGLVGHLLSYLVTNAMLWIFFLGNAGDFPWWMVFVSGGWGIGIAAHAWGYYTEHGPGARKREERIQRAVDEELRRHKRKHEVLEDNLSVSDARAVRLTDEGELTDSFVEEVEQRRMRR